MQQQTRDTVDAMDALQRIFAGESLADLAGLPKAQMESIYAEAHGLVEQQDFDGALDLLTYLAMMEPHDFRFQFGCGLCLHMLGEVEDAARHYGLAYMLDASDAGCAYRLGECHEALGDPEASADAFRVAISLCNLPDASPDIRVLAEAALDRLNGQGA